MLIESLIHPKATKKPTRTVQANGKAFEFVQVRPGRFVADVDDEVAAQALLRIPHAYREFTESLDTGALSRAKPAPAPAAPPAPNRAEVQKQAAAAENAAAQAAAAERQKQLENDPTVNDLDAAARALLGSTPVAIKRQLDRKPPSAAVLSRAIELETGEKKPREQVLANLRGVLSSVGA